MTDKGLDLGEPKPHWELAGETFPEDLANFPKVLEVHKVKLVYTSPISRKQKQINKYVLINGLDEELGVVGPSYQPVEPRDIITPLLAAQLPILYYGVMGSISQPRAWVMFRTRNKIPNLLEEAGVQPVLFVMNSFNKSRAIDFRPGFVWHRTFMPVHCPPFTVRHTRSAMGRLRTLPNHLALAEKCIDDGVHALWQPVDQLIKLIEVFERATQIDEEFRVTKGNASRRVKSELQSFIDGKAMKAKLQLWKEI